MVKSRVCGHYITPGIAYVYDRGSTNQAPFHQGQNLEKLGYLLKSILNAMESTQLLGCKTI
jgi:hypothetical protein